MTSNRPYRQGMNEEEALKEFEQLAGILYDPEAVEHFARIFRSGDKIQSYQLLPEQ